jgi:hypothetical protein
VTLLHGTLHSSKQDWKDHHGKPCFIEEVRFSRWLAGKRSPTAEAPRPAEANAFDKQYWDYMMVLAWVYFRERALVERVTASAVNGETYWHEVRLPDGRTEMVQTQAGPITPLNLTLHAVWRREDPTRAGAAPAITCDEAEGSILDQLRAGTLTAYGLENDAGDLREIPALWWADGKVYEGRGRPYAGSEEVFRSGATRWHGLRIKRDQVLTLWPELLVSTAQNTAEPASLQDNSSTNSTLSSRKRANRRGGRRRGPYFQRLRKFLEWYDDNRDGGVQAPTLKQLAADARKRLEQDRVIGVPVSRSAFEEAIKEIKEDLLAKASIGRVIRRNQN